jgi:hypothetical protein
MWVLKDSFLSNQMPSHLTSSFGSMVIVSDICTEVDIEVSLILSL